MTAFPNQALLPLTESERFAADRAHTPGLLMEIARETGNRSLQALAVNLLRQRDQSRRERGIPSFKKGGRRA
jgi:hypothetical protein